MVPSDIDFPPYKGHCVKVSVINGARAHMLSELLVHPAPKGRKYLDMAHYSFLIESEHCQKKVLFDLAFMQNLHSRMPPALKAMFAGNEEVMGIDDFQHVPDTIKAHGMELSAIDAIIWSHAHIDHTGDLSVFPPNTELIVGPGSKERFIPGYPTNPNSIVLDSAFQGRSVRELDFTASTTVIGGFRSIDLFDDGSFWLLEAPGHTSHHICALCRTSKDSWIFCGGDACHNIAQLRPNPARPLPDNVPAKALGRSAPPDQCSCAHMLPLVKQTAGGSFYDLARGMQESVEEAEKTMEKLKAFDGRDDVLIIIAHDATLLNTLDLFPKNVNDWRAKGWGAQSRWLFLKELDEEATAMS